MPERHTPEHQEDDRDDDEDVEDKVEEEGIHCIESMEYRVWSIDDAGRLRAEAELIGWSVGRRAGGMQMGRTHFQVSGLSRREPGSGIRVRVQVQVLNFAPCPYLFFITRTRDLRAETWDPKMRSTFAPLHRP